AKALETDRGIETIHLVEADARALDCARINVPNPRAQMHWADARTWNVSDGVDAVITNPPFHTGRVADPDLGRAFIISAARLLRPKGALWLVANRHLPYEATLSDHFGQVQEISGTGSFKVLHAQRPSRPRA
ncbi:MAG: methyltransferase, partial [Pseudomonadota bacterium]